MRDNQNKIIAVVGLAGSGKTTVVDYITEKGFPKVYLGGIIFEAMEQAGIERTPENGQKFREEIREKEGKDFVIRRAIDQAHKLIEAGQHHIVFDGLYSWTEYKILKHEFPGEVTIVAVTAPRVIRHRRLSVRPENPYTQSEADQRDWSEIENLEKGGPIAIADHLIVNDGTIEELYEKVDKVLDEIEFRN